MIFTPTRSPPPMQPLPNKVVQVTEDDMSDASESSTISAGFASIPKRWQHQPQVGRRRKKTVSFDESQNVSHEPIYDSSAWPDVWYTAFDLQGFRALNLHALQKFQREFAATRGPLVSLTTVVEQSYDACLSMMYDGIEVLCAVEMARLRQAVQDPNFQPGLVTYLSPNVRDDVRMRRTKIARVVKLIQQNAAAQGIDRHAAVVADCIRTAAADISRPSRLFAELVAQNAQG